MSTGYYITGDLLVTGRLGHEDLAGRPRLMPERHHETLGTAALAKLFGDPTAVGSRLRNLGFSRYANLIAQLETTMPREPSNPFSTS